MKRIYMDNGATTRVTEPVMEAMQPYFGEIFGNPPTGGMGNATISLSQGFTCADSALKYIGK